MPGLLCPSVRNVNLSLELHRSLHPRESSVVPTFNTQPSSESVEMNRQRVSDNVVYLLYLEISDFIFILRIELRTLSLSDRHL